MDIGLTVIGGVLLTGITLWWWGQMDYCETPAPGFVDEFMGRNPEELYPIKVVDSVLVGANSGLSEQNGDQNVQRTLLDH